MQKTSLFNIIKPYLAACIALTLTIALATSAYFLSELALHWSIALWFSLLSVLIVIIIQIVYTEKNIKNYSEQLAVNKERLTNEIKELALL